MVTIEGLGFSEIPANVMVSVAGKFIKEFSNLQEKKMYSPFESDKEKLKQHCRIIVRLSVFMPSKTILSIWSDILQLERPWFW